MEANEAPDKRKYVTALFLQQRIKHMLTANFEEQRGQHGRSYESAEAQFEVNMQNLHRMVRSTEFCTQLCMSTHRVMV
jgi:hypothetical protein